MTREQLLARLRAAIEQLFPQHIGMRQLEALLGLSKGYLSKLRHSHRMTPSPVLVSLLALLAVDPAQRISELVEFWREFKPHPS